jgi:hypothetical protein
MESFDFMINLVCVLIYPNHFKTPEAQFQLIDFLSGNPHSSTLRLMLQEQLLLYYAVVGGDRLLS